MVVNTQQGISLILPAYNEESTILEMARETVLAMEDLNLDYEIIIVDDGSTDSTPDQSD